jgi:hypothetical protein
VGLTVPAPHDVIVTVRVVPESVPGANTHPVAVPDVLLKSAAATPVTASEKVSVKARLAELVGVEFAEVNDTTVGAVVSMTIADVPAMLFDPEGTAVEVMALPAASATDVMVNDDTVRSADVSPAPMVYVPVIVVPAEAAVRVITSPVSSVTTMLAPL